MKDFWDTNGYLQIDNLLSAEELKTVLITYDQLLNGAYNTKGFRSDLSGISQLESQEKITQIMRPCLIDDHIKELPHFEKTKSIAKKLLGEDIEMDFDMIINKNPKTYTETPWHQDAAYWPELSDKRACSFWIALDDVDEENGCMMYVPKSHTEVLRSHKLTNSKGALKTELKKTDFIIHGILSKGSSIVHHGHTLHGAKGNSSSDRTRKAWIVNYRPKKMISEMRSAGYDHTGNRKNTPT